MNYFAYGSNMCTHRLRERVPSCRFLAVAKLPGHALRFHKGGRNDGSGKCNIFPTGIADDAVIGVLYAMAPAEKANLDRVEGVGFGYRSIEVSVETAEGPARAWTYRAEEAAIDERLVPYTWYKEFVLQGAIEHGLPAWYVRAIAEVPAVEDSDELRVQRARAILLAARG